MINSIRGKTVLLHREIMKATNKQMVDHINGDALDNRKENLRFCDHSKNAMNSKMRADNKAGYRGVHWHTQAKKWQAQIVTRGYHRSLGLFDKKKDAARAYNKAARELHGEFARLNDV